MSYAVKSSRKTKPRQEARAGKLITFDEYFEIADEKTRTDLLDGKIIRDSPAVAKHGRINSWLAQVIGFYVAKHDLGEIFFPTTSVRFTQYQATEPDLFFISKAGPPAFECFAGLLVEAGMAARRVARGFAGVERNSG